MSSINSVSNAYRQIYTSSATQSHQANTQHMRTANGQSGLAVRDQISISDEGLQALIDNGTLTEEEKSAIDEAFMTAMESSQLGSQQQSQTRVDPLASLIADGTITEEQRDAVKSVLDSARGQDSKRPGGPPPGGMPPGPPPSGGVGGSNATRSTDSTEYEDDTIEALLKSLIENGTIDEEEKTSILQAFQSNSLFNWNDSL